MGQYEMEPFSAPRKVSPLFLLLLVQIRCTHSFMNRPLNAAPYRGTFETLASGFTFTKLLPARCTFAKRAMSPIGVCSLRPTRRLLSARGLTCLLRCQRN